MITVPTTASRFALLQIDSDSDSDASDAGKTSSKGGRESGKARQGKAGASGAKASQCNGKKKDKKKKKKEQQQTEANEVGVKNIDLPSALYDFMIWRLNRLPIFSGCCAASFVLPEISVIIHLRHIS